MKFKTIIFFLALLFIYNSNAQNIIQLEPSFDKIIVSPHIEAVLKKGDKPSIKIEDINVSKEKFKYELKNGTLQVYLEGAKTYTKNKKIVIRNHERKVPLYKNRVVRIIITYVDIKTFSFRGKEKITFKSSLKQEQCKLRIYGKSEVTIPNINVNNLNVSIYGDSFLSLEKGTVQKQKITAYGESKVMAADIVSKETKLTAYGSGTFQVNASERIKVSSYGEATILYKGDGKLKKGIVIGASKIKRVQ